MNSNAGVTSQALTTTHRSPGELKNQLTLECADGKTIVVDRDIAEVCRLIKDRVGDRGKDAFKKPIPIPCVNAAVLKKVIEWCTRHRQNGVRPEDGPHLWQEIAGVDIWDQEFVQVDQEMLFEILLAADYLDIEGLLDLCFETIANLMKGKSPRGSPKDLQHSERSNYGGRTTDTRRK
ncbi:E3 ubiquitin ligase complex SCF subunit sconC [Cladophialophora immunda]|uniref:E3 ubiquitin ligase complex SCF subunit sconC n=1 Tax=Cladophialophora immunda TaxID=569365 RepID=A0A0D2BTT7_9EURO|nr:E3 ubiquitin ligase complex SCF subunit sconC [Cladophialophora immunda]KIW21840.1 E3 ubiquitin ligase complex SCF subunit sconC [Cladophialophora immunda]